MGNTYDNEAFFRQYAAMSRSREGLSAAGEWHQLKPMFPALRGKSVLDLGCGYVNFPQSRGRPGFWGSI